MSLKLWEEWKEKCELAQGRARNAEAANRGLGLKEDISSV